MERVFLEAARGAERVSVATHDLPDADGVGSQAALCLALRAWGAKARGVSQEALPARYRHLDPEGLVLPLGRHRSWLGGACADLLVVVDAGSLARLSPGVRELARDARRVLFIDHHPGPETGSGGHCVDPSAAATGEIVAGLVESLGVALTKDMALALYTALLIDTNSFRYSTVSPATHATAARLMGAGVRADEAYGRIYGKRPMGHLRLLGRLLGEARTTEDGAVAWMVLTEAMLQEHGSDLEDVHHAVNHLLVLDGVRIACLFKEMEGGTKVSLRSTGDVDAAGVAEALGGGGHRHAAAALLPGPPDQVLEDAVKRIRGLLSD